MLRVGSAMLSNFARRSVPAATAIFQTHQYLLLSPIHFLTLLDHKASESSKQQGPGSTLELLPQDLDRFRTLQKANRSYKLH